MKKSVQRRNRSWIEKSRILPSQYSKKTGRILVNYGGSTWTSLSPGNSMVNPDLFAQWSLNYVTNGTKYYVPEYVSDGKEYIMYTPYKRPFINTCYHYSCRHEWKTFGWASLIGNHPAYGDLLSFQLYNFSSANIGTLYNFGEQHRHLVWDEEFSRRARFSFNPLFEGKTSTINFIFELKDFRKYVKFLNAPYLRSRLANMCTDFAGPRTAAKRRGKGLGKNARKLLKTGADLELWYSYEVIPTLKDLCAMFANLATTANSFQSDLIARGIDGTLVHYGERQVLRSDLTTHPWGVMSMGYELSKLRTAFGFMHYNYVRRSTVDAFIHYWGLTGNAEAFWNMLPFSFLIDYIYGVNDMLRATRTDENLSDAKLDYGESIKIELISGYITRPAFHPYVAHIDYVPDIFRTPKLLAGWRTKWYYRSKREPLVVSGMYKPLKKLTSDHQALNTACLGISMFL